MIMDFPQFYPYLIAVSSSLFSLRSGERQWIFLLSFSPLYSPLRTYRKESNNLKTKAYVVLKFHLGQGIVCGFTGYFHFIIRNYLPLRMHQHVGGSVRTQSLANCSSSPSFSAPLYFWNSAFQKIMRSEVNWQSQVQQFLLVRNIRIE